MNDKSLGHVFFAAMDETTEYFVRQGQLLRAPISNVIMPDGYRCGRFEGMAGHVDAVRNTLKSNGIKTI